MQEIISIPLKITDKGFGDYMSEEEKECGDKCMEEMVTPIAILQGIS
jgi:hypothetical protein